MTNQLFGVQSTMFLTHMLIWIFAGSLMAQTCVPMAKTSLKVTSVYTGQRLDGYEISLLQGFKLPRCADECFLVSLCKSFNYCAANGVCELNSVSLDDVGDSSLINVTGFTYHDIQDWPAVRTYRRLAGDYCISYEITKETVGTCATRPCEDNQRCIPTTPFTCVDIDCGQPPVYTDTFPWFMVTRRAQYNGTTLGSKADYTCSDNRFNKISNLYAIPHWKSSVKTCNSDSSWSPQQLRCNSRINDCKDVKRCNPNYGDGHYWLHNRGWLHKPYKAYCHNLATSADIYITLPHYGISSYTDSHNGEFYRVLKQFSKVRILDYDLKIDINDDTFAEDQGRQEDVPFASAGSCGTMRNGEKYYGHFSVNTRGTKLRLGQQINWDIPSGSEMVNYSIDANGMVGYCWGSICSLCKPRCLDFIYYPEGEVDGTDTTYPSNCIFETT